ncbi:MAG: hypothetical protein AAFV87_12475 [Pseudomonadota bacterium]
MFPLAVNTVLLLVLIALLASAATFTTLRGWPKAWLATLLLFVGATWPWPIAVFLGLDYYTTRVAFYASAWTAGAILVGLVWGVLARRVSTTGPVLLVALAPPLVLSAYLLERQRVPDARCASEVDFTIGNLDLTIPRHIGLASVETDGVLSQEWAGSYGDGANGKPDVRALCRATNGGTEPIRVAHIRLSFSAFRRDLEAECENEATQPSSRPLCRALTLTQPTVVQFYSYPEGMSLPTLGLFTSDTVVQARAGGALQGFECNDSTKGPERRHCKIWQDVTPDVFIVFSAWAGPEEEGEDLVATSEPLLEDFISRLSAD